MPQITLPQSKESSSSEVTAPAIGALTEAQLAQRWAIARKTLQAWRLRGGGPKFVRIGTAIRYMMADVLEYESANKCDSTSSSVA